MGKKSKKQGKCCLCKLKAQQLITLVAWDLPAQTMRECYLAVSELSESPLIDLLDVEDATPMQQAALTSSLVEI